MQVLKVIVIGLAVVIVVGTGVLAYGWTHHWNRSASTADAPPNPPPDHVHAPMTDTDASADGAPYDVTVPAPEGMHFEQMAVAGNRALLRFSGPQGERILVVDPRSGRVTGAIGVTAAGK